MVITFNKEPKGMKIEQDITIVAVIAARNEQEFLLQTLESLGKQTRPIHKIVVIDDGSEDNTSEIAKQANCEVINLPYHRESYISRPELAQVWNEGFKLAEKYNSTYILVSGADTLYPPNYIENILQYFDSDTVIVSGSIEGQPSNESYPRGSGRVVDVDFWKKVSGLRYPVSYAWEDYIVYKALELGYKTKSIRDVVFQSRKLTMNVNTAGNSGKAMRELGYYWVRALARSVFLFIRNPVAGSNMFFRYITHDSKVDCAAFVREYQRKNFYRKIKNLVFLRKHLT